MKLQLQSLGKRFTTLFKTRKYATKPIRCDAHMNELPVPCGSWEIYYKDQQTWYSQCLVAGALWWVFSLAAMIYTESVFFNFFPPCQPGPPSDMYVSEYRCDAHMNELPVPCGPWHTWYRGRQKFYTQCLVAGALWWLFSLIMMIWTGSLFLNWGPPANPGPPSDMIEECEDD